MMNGKGIKSISQFFLAGINYKKTDAALRGEFAISPVQYEKLLSGGPDFGIHEFFVLSTCNRTEIYGFAESEEHLVDFLCQQTNGRKELFHQIAYTRQGIDAVAHLFQVGAGLDSQLLGDYEIVGQIRQAAKQAKLYNRIDAFTERLINSVLQSSKAIKNNTQLSSGSISVAFSAVQYIRRFFTNLKGKKILIIGTGKIGRNTCKNLVEYLGTKEITLVNRTSEKAEQLATELGLQFAAIEDLNILLPQSDIIIVATHANEPILSREHFIKTDQKLILDLSIPNNVEPELGDFPFITLENVDSLSKQKDETLNIRKAEIPKARKIIDTHLSEFNQWYELRKHVPVLKAVKSKLQEIHASPKFLPSYTPPAYVKNPEEKIQRVLNGMAVKMKSQNQQGCHYIEAINEFIATGTN